jgi:hypothetical protein
MAGDSTSMRAHTPGMHKKPCTCTAPTPPPANHHHHPPTHPPTYTPNELNGEHHAHKGGGEEADAKGAWADGIELLQRVLPVYLAWVEVA